MLCVCIFFLFHSDINEKSDLHTDVFQNTKINTSDVTDLEQYQ